MRRLLVWRITVLGAPIPKALGLVAAALISIATVMVLAGNRPASYIPTPVSNVYVADLFFFIGALCALANWRRLIPLPRVYWLLFGLVTLYVTILGLEMLLAKTPLRNSLRDMAPFLFLAAVPLVAIVFSLRSRSLSIYIIRVASIGLLAGKVLTEFLTPIVQQRTGFPIGLSVLPYRDDLAGIAFGLGILSWDRWKRLGVTGQPLILVPFVFLSLVLTLSRSGWLAILIAVAFVALRPRGDKAWCIRTTIVSAALIGIGVSIAIPSGVSTLAKTISPTEMELNAQSGSVGVEASALMESTPGNSGLHPQEPVNPSPLPANYVPSDLVGGLPTFLATRVSRVGTTNARIETWAYVVGGMWNQGTLLLGGSLGSDYLYELCTGVATAPKQLSVGDPKCPVYSYEPVPIPRDPHNFPLYILVTHGLLGLLIFFAPIAVLLWSQRGTPGYAFYAVGILLIVTTGLTMVMSAGYVLIPLSVLLAGTLAERMRTQV